MTKVDAIMAAVRRCPGGSVSEIVAMIDDASADVDLKTAAVTLLNLTNSGRVKREKVDGRFRYWPADGKTVTPFKFPESAATATLPAAPAQRPIGKPRQADIADWAITARRTAQEVVGNWIVVGMPDDAIILVNRDTDVGMRIDAETVRAILAIAGYARPAVA